MVGAGGGLFGNENENEIRDAVGCLCVVVWLCGRRWFVRGV